jgi:phosphoserine phosphatase
MRIAVFLDVDNTLTADFIQKQYARALGCESEYCALEAKFQDQKLSSSEFGQQLVDLFAGRQFTREAANKYFKDVKLQPWTDDLRRLQGVDKYLVSSGPSYYIDPLAERYQIPPENRCRSAYEFSEETGLIMSCAAVSTQNKSEFVRKRRERYDITIGVGDSDEFDGPFLSQVTIPLMTAISSNYISIPDFQSVILLIDRLSRIADADHRYAAALERLYAESSYDKNVFIMTPFRSNAAYRETIRAIKDSLAGLGLRGWLASELSLEQQLWDNVRVFMAGCKAGIAVFTSDQAKDVDKSSTDVFNPNVSIEAGYMLSRKKPVLMLKDKSLNKLPTDMVGFLYRDFDLQDATLSVNNSIQQWVKTEGL